MANLRFPSNAVSGNKPFILFSTHKAQYSTIGDKVDTIPTANSVALYFPTGYAINDSLNYQQEATGLIGAGFSGLQGSGNDISGTDVKKVVEGAMTNKELASKTAGGLAGLAGSSKGFFSALGSALATGGVVGNVAAEISRSSQIALNPREFMLFKSPNIRNFSFNFTFIPSNDQEVRDVPEIIKFFRKASYPTLSGAGATYNFPEAFNINVGNSENVIKIPEVVCTTVGVTYNSNSMSYFELNNLPVEINLTLGFQELQPISKEFIDQGY